MPALDSATSAFLTRVKDALRQGSELDVPPNTPGNGTIRAAAQNYLRAQDMASVLDLLQAALSQPSALTAVGGTTFSVEDGAATFVANTQIGNTVVFAGNTTAALAGVTARVIANDAVELFFADELPAAPAAGDEYTILGTMLDDFVDDLREGKGLADSPAGSVYGENRTAVGGILRGVELLGSSVTERQVSAADQETAAGSTETVVQLAPLGRDFVVDQFRGMKVTISGESRIVESSDETSVTVRGAFSSAPAAGTSVSITIPVDNFGGVTAPKILTHPGAQPGENAYLAELIETLEAAVVAFTLPT